MKIELETIFHKGGGATQNIKVDDVDATVYDVQRALEMMKEKLTRQMGIKCKEDNVPKSHWDEFITMTKLADVFKTTEQA